MELGTGAVLTALMLFFMVVGGLITVIGSWIHPRIPEGISIVTGLGALYFGVNMFWSLGIDQISESLILGIEFGGSPVFAIVLFIAFGGMTMGNLTAQRV